MTQVAGIYFHFINVCKLVSQYTIILCQKERLYFLVGTFQRACLDGSSAPARCGLGDPDKPRAAGHWHCLTIQTDVTFKRGSFYGQAAQ